MTPEEAYRSGQWTALDRVLALLQTYEDKVVRKSVFYHDVMEMRPKEYESVKGLFAQYDQHATR